MIINGEIIIYLVVNDWATKDGHGVETYAFSMVSKAMTKMTELIDTVCKNQFAQAINEDEKLVDGYCLNKSECCCWEIWKDGCYDSSHAKIEIRELEVM